MKKFLNKNILYLAWFFALVSTLGSLYFSDVLKFPPCVLCWYQRICMYPLVVIIGVGILLREKKLYLYVLPLSIIGFFIALYHNLLYYNILPESTSPCISGVSCTTKFIEWFGFITIPLLSFMGFTLISICMIIYSRINKKNENRG